jgi:glycosyltransferase involved in cell wall biosynthesis
MVLIDAFRELQARGWSLHLAGGVDETGPSHEYLLGLRRYAAGLPVYFHPDASGAQLARLFSEACLYWHAAGLGVDPIRRPDAVEQFGISIVEAMAAGSVPLAYGSGGPVEIIEHKRSGFVWRTADDLVQTTLLLIRNASLLAEVRERALKRSMRFHVGALEAQARAWYLEGDVVPIHFDCAI